MKCATTFDMVWFALGALGGLLSLLNGKGQGIGTVVISGLCLFYAWKAYSTSNNSTDGEKLTFFKCYKNFRLVLIWLHFIIAAVALVWGVVLIVSSGSTSGDKQLVFTLGAVSIAAAGILSIPGFVFWSTQKGINADILALEQHQATHGMNPAL